MDVHGNHASIMILPSDLACVWIPGRLASFDACVTLNANRVFLALVSARCQVCQCWLNRMSASTALRFVVSYTNIERSVVSYTNIRT